MRQREYMTEFEVAEKLGISPKTLRNHRTRGEGLPYVRIGRTIRYKSTEVEAYLEEHTVRPKGRKS